MEVKYELYSDADGIDRALRESVSNRLYVPGWTMRDFMIYQKELVKHAVIGRVDHTPVALAMLVREVPYDFLATDEFSEDFVHWFMIFVRRKHRRKGIGTKMFNIVNEATEEAIFVGRHDDKTSSFFNSLDTTLPQHPDYLHNLYDLGKEIEC